MQESFTSRVDYSLTSAPLALTFFFLASSPSAIVQAETHNFKPTGYVREFSPHPQPVLQVRPGDVVVTTCVDSNGDDETGTKVTEPYNPLTGPFYIEGAMPNDTLVIVLERIRLNRATGVGSTRIAPTAVTPQYLIAQKAQSRKVIWNFDFKTMTANADSSSGLRGFRVPLRPFLGCIGVAPALREAQSSITNDTHGGNMDYNQLVEGTRVYMPVNVKGAYFYLGDGHAAQGEGETSGGAIETSMQVQFRIELLKNKAISSPRAETDEYYMAMGMGKPLDEAFQRATVNMIEWLTRDFDFTIEEAQVMLGTSAEYDIAVVVTPRYTVVCKLKKETVQRMVSRRASRGLDSYDRVPTPAARPSFSALEIKARRALRTPQRAGVPPLFTP